MFLTRRSAALGLLAAVTAAPALAAVRDDGALTVALVNDTFSPLASTCEVVLPLHAGPEKSVAATKSFIAALAASLQLVAHWSQDGELLAALDGLELRHTARLLRWAGRVLDPVIGKSLVVYLRRPG